MIIEKLEKAIRLLKEVKTEIKPIEKFKERLVGILEEKPKIKRPRKQKEPEGKHSTFG